MDRIVIRTNVFSMFPGQFPPSNSSCPSNYQHRFLSGPKLGVENHCAVRLTDVGRVQQSEIDPCSPAMVVFERINCPPLTEHTNTTPILPVLR